MYTLIEYILIYRYFSKAALSLISLHTIGRLATVPFHMSLQSTVIRVNSDVWCPRAEHSGRIYTKWIG